MWRAKERCVLTGEDCQSNDRLDWRRLPAMNPEYHRRPGAMARPVLGVLEVTHEHDHAFGDGDVRA